MYTASGALSDCQLIVSNDKVRWYVTNNSAPVFYSIELNAPSKLTVK